MKNSLFLTLLLICNSGFAKSDTVFTVNFTNHMTDNTLYIDVKYDEATCTFDTSEPLQKPTDVFYLNRDGLRTELSGIFKDYFEPTMLSIEPFQARFSAKALDNIPQEGQENAKKEVIVNLKKNGKDCQVSNSMELEGENIEIKSILIKLSKILGIPTGASWVYITFLTAEGATGNACVLGDCDPKNHQDFDVPTEE